MSRTTSIAGIVQLHATTRGWLSRVLVGLVLLALGVLIPTHNFGHFETATAGEHSSHHDHNHDHNHDSSHCSLCLLAASMTFVPPADAAPALVITPEHPRPVHIQIASLGDVPAPYFTRGPPTF